MDYLITRMYRNGRVLPIQLRNAQTVRAGVSVREVADPTRHRTALVAHAHCGIQFRSDLPPPLWDVCLVATVGSAWVITGFEKVLGGPLQEESHVAQSWHLTPAPLEDLLVAEREWANLAEKVAQLTAAASKE